MIALKFKVEYGHFKPGDVAEFPDIIAKKILKNNFANIIEDYISTKSTKKPVVSLIKKVT